jgi:Zn-dependent protease with chaperone function
MHSVQLGQPQTGFWGAVERAHNSIRPISPLTGKRAFIPLNLHIEHFMGGVAHALLARGRIRSFREIKWRPLQGGSSSGQASGSGQVVLPVEKAKKEYVSTLVSRVFQKLQPGVPNWPSTLWDLNLGKEEGTPWNWSLHVYRGSDIEAFALPGGGIFVSDFIVKELSNWMGRKQSESGSQAWTESVEVGVGKDQEILTFDLSDVTTEDAVAALLGHEMTHVGARHGVIGLLPALVVGMASLVLRIIAWVQALRASREQKKKDAEGIGPVREQTELLEQAKLYRNSAAALDQLHHLFGKAFQLFTSRQHEYQADEIGTRLAKRAGYNPKGAVVLYSFLKELQPGDGWFARFMESFRTHPRSAERLRRVASLITKDPELSDSNRA